MQAPQVEAPRIARRRDGTRRKALDLELRKCAADVGEKPRPVGGGSRAKKQHRRGKLRVTPIDRRIGLVRPADKKDRGEDQVNGDDRGDHQGRDLAADIPQVQKIGQLHDGPLMGIVIASTDGVNI